MDKRRFLHYLSILLLGILLGGVVTLLAWLQHWFPFKAPEQYITALSWTGIVVVISFGLYLHAKYPLLSRLWIFGAVCVAVVLVYLFPETLAPGCGGMPKAFAHCFNSCEDICDLPPTCTAWQAYPCSLCSAAAHAAGTCIGCCYSYGPPGCRNVCYNVCVDDPPTVSGTVNCGHWGSNGWCNGSSSLSITATDPQGYALTISGDLSGTPFSCSSGSCTINLPEGTGTANFTALASTSLKTASGSATWQRDVTNPGLNGSLTGHPVNGWYNTDVTIGIAPTDAASGVASQGVSLDGTTWSPSLTVSADGSYTAWWTATDKAGNTATTHQSFQIDQTPPTLSVTPVSGWSKLPVTLTATANDPSAGSGQASGLDSLKYSLDGGPMQDGSSVTVSSEGTHTVEFQATDLAGNVSTSSTDVKIDATPPTFSFSPSSSGWYPSAVTVNSGASDAPSGLASVKYSLDGGSSWNDGSSVAFNSNGLHSVLFQATDNAGNSATSAMLAVNVDLTDPTFVPVISGTLGTNNWYTSAITVSAGAGDTVSGINASSLETWADGGPTWQSGASATFSTDGSHRVSFRADDNAGRSANSAEIDIKIDTLPPVSTFLSPVDGTSVTATGNLVLTGQITDPTSDVSSAQLSLDGGTTWSVLSLDTAGNWTYSWDVDSVPNGIYTVRVRSTDKAGNTEQAAHVTVAVDNDAPSVSLTPTFFLWQTAAIHISPAAVPVTGARITIIHPSNHALDKIFTFDSSNLPTSFQWDGSWADGSSVGIGIYTVTLEAWDAYGHTGKASGLVILPLPSQPKPTVTTAFALPPARTPTRTPTSTDTRVPTATPALSVVEGSTPRTTSTTTSTRVVSVVLVANPPQEPIKDETPIPLQSDNVLWGAAAVAATAATLAMALEDKRRRDELAAQADAQKAREKAIEKAQHEYQSALYAAYVAQKVQKQQEAMDAAAKAEQISVANQFAHQMAAQVTDSESFANNKVARDNLDPDQYEKLLKSFRDADEKASNIPVLNCNYDDPNIIRPSYNNWPSNIPFPTPEPTLDPGPSLTDVLNASCQVSDAVDPYSPDPATVGTNSGIGEAIDQLAISVDQMPLTGIPLSDTAIESAKIGVTGLEFFKNFVSTPYNFVCQQVEHEGYYYDLFPIDKAIPNYVNRWNDMSTLQKVGDVVVTVAIIAVIAAIVISL